MLKTVVISEREQKQKAFFHCNMAPNADSFGEFKGYEDELMYFLTVGKFENGTKIRYFLSRYTVHRLHEIRRLE